MAARIPALVSVTRLNGQRIAERVEVDDADPTDNQWQVGNKWTYEDRRLGTPGVTFPVENTLFTQDENGIHVEAIEIKSENS